MDLFELYLLKVGLLLNGLVLVEEHDVLVGSAAEEVRVADRDLFDGVGVAAHFVQQLEGVHLPDLEVVDLAEGDAEERREVGAAQVAHVRRGRRPVLAVCLEQQQVRRVADDQRHVVLLQEGLRGLLLLRGQLLGLVLLALELVQRLVRDLHLLRQLEVREVDRLHVELPQERVLAGCEQEIQTLGFVV